MNKLSEAGWFQIYELEREQHQDQLTQMRLEHESQKAFKHEQLLEIIRRGECDGD
jgi:hypothetical protein